jgi:hypothetical protein
MSHRIDHLFKDKLDEYKVAPSDEAWGRVQAGLKKNRLIILWRIAAAVVIAAALIGWLNMNKDADLPPELVQKPMQKTPEEIVLPSQPGEPEAKEKTLLAKQTNPTGAKYRKDEKPVEPVTRTEEHVETGTLPLQAIAEIKPGAEEVKPDKAIVIEFTLPAIVTSDTQLAGVVKEQKSGLKKFIDTARDVKNGDADVSGGLREMKNELLAFDFIRNKPKRN